MIRISIDNLMFTLFNIGSSPVCTIEVYDNKELCGQGIFNISDFLDDDEDGYYLYKWFDEEDENGKKFPLCIDTIETEDGYNRLKAVGVDEL